SRSLCWIMGVTYCMPVRAVDFSWMMGRMSLRAISDLLPTGTDAGHHGLDAVAVNGLDALGRDRQRDATPLGGHEVAAALDVRVPATVGPTVRVRDGLAESRLPSRYLAMRRHGVFLLPPRPEVARGDTGTAPISGRAGEQQVATSRTDRKSVV